MSRRRQWTKETILQAIQAFVAQQGRIPGYEDFRHCAHGLPAVATCNVWFIRWQRAVQQAGYVPPPPAPRRRGTLPLFTRKGAAV
jgi:Homing endonuclease associated repeat